MLGRGRAHLGPPDGRDRRLPIRCRYRRSGNCCSRAEVEVHRGPSYATDALIVSNLKGPLGDVRVRQALSIAIDRKAYVQTLYKGVATLPRTLANPGAWGYGKKVFEADWNAQPEMTLDLKRAKELLA